VLEFLQVRLAGYCRRRFSSSNSRQETAVVHSQQGEADAKQDNRHLALLAVPPHHIAPVLAIEAAPLNPNCSDKCIAHHVKVLERGVVAYVKPSSDCDGRKPPTYLPAVNDNLLVSVTAQVDVGGGDDSGDLAQPSVESVLLLGRHMDITARHILLMLLQAAIAARRLHAVDPAVEPAVEQSPSCESVYMLTVMDAMAVVLLPSMWRGQVLRETSPCFMRPGHLESSRFPAISTLTIAAVTSSTVSTIMVAGHVCAFMRSLCASLCSSEGCTGTSSVADTNRVE
jgi:hypothetical protein